MDVAYEVEGFANAGAVLAGHAQFDPAAEADADEDGVVIGEERVGGDVLADGDAGADFDAEGFYQVHLLEADLGFHFVIGDAVGVESAGVLVLLKHDDLVAEAGEFGGATEAGRTAADDGVF